ncbi:MAG TPA: acylphosphatase [Oribacterium sp.]|jgi:acylphosphatase|nr:acylphosphatase [Oribacterium sp.]
MALEQEIERWHFQFYGRVQGVGFRFTAGYLARSLDLTGWVRNEYDGSVTMEVQGRSDAIEHFLNSLQTQRYIQIENYEREAISPIQEQRFRTEY